MLKEEGGGKGGERLRQGGELDLAHEFH